MPAIFIKSATTLEELPKSDKPHIAFVGRSNVGKSSLLNDLVQQKNLARESAEPGRTQTLNLFEVNGRFFLVDLPGYGFAKTSKAKRDRFARILHEYLWQAQQLKFVFLVIDARQEMTDLDLDMFHYLEDSKLPFALIVNKTDKLSYSQTVAVLQGLASKYSHLSIVPHSSVTGQGRGEIREMIERVVRNAA